MALQGDVETVPLRDVVAWLAQQRASGTLSLSRGMIVRRFHLQGGQVMLASSTEEETLLGRLLVARGLIDGTQLAAALESRRRRSRLGKTLTRAGAVSRAEVGSVLSDKVVRLLDDALTWTEGRFFFDHAVPARKRPAVTAAVDLATVLARPPGGPSADAEGRLVVSDDDILEVTDLPRRRRAASRRA
jgi:hypothetical protein